MYKKINPDMNFVGRELEVLDFWKKNKIFGVRRLRKLRTLRKHLPGVRNKNRERKARMDKRKVRYVFGVSVKMPEKRNLD